jgi:hypothetical protein
MKCKEIANLLAAYAENQVSLEQRQLVERHLDHCIDCRAALIDIHTIGERLKSLRSTADLPDMAVINISDTKPVKRDKFNNRVCYALAAIPVIVIVIILAVLQPWVSSSNPQAILAKAINAVGNVKSYRTYSSPGIIITGPDGTDYKNNFKYEEYDLPDKAHWKLMISGKLSEYIFIGNKEYFLVDNSLIFTFPDMPGFTPNIDQAIEELHAITSVKILDNEIIDNVDCIHYLGTDKRNPDYTIELWISEKDYLIRQEIIQGKNAEGSITSLTKYYDFNQPIDIEPPLDTEGNLLPGWKVHIMSQTQSEYRLLPDLTTTSTAGYKTPPE